MRRRCWVWFKNKLRITCIDGPTDTAVCVFQECGAALGERLTAAASEKALVTTVLKTPESVIFRNIGFSNNKMRDYSIDHHTSQNIGR